MNEQAQARAIVISALLQHSRYKGDDRNFMNLDSQIYQEADQIMQWVNNQTAVGVLERPQEVIP